MEEMYMLKSLKKEVETENAVVVNAEITIEGDVIPEIEVIDEIQIEKLNVQNRSLKVRQDQGDPEDS